MHARRPERDLADLDPADVHGDEIDLLVHLEPARVDPDPGHGGDDLVTADWVPETVTC